MAKKHLPHWGSNRGPSVCEPSTLTLDLSANSVASFAVKMILPLFVMHVLRPTIRLLFKVKSCHRWINHNIGGKVFDSRGNEDFFSLLIMK